MKLLPPIRNWIVDDFGWKLFSVVLAAIIWLTVHKILDETKTVATADDETRITYNNLPLKMVSSTSDVSLYRPAALTVSVSVSGPRKLMDTLMPGQIHATVDLTGIETAKELRRQVEVSVPSGVGVEDISPKDVGIIPPPKP